MSVGMVVIAALLIIALLVFWCNKQFKLRHSFRVGVNPGTHSVHMHQNLCKVSTRSFLMNSQPAIVAPLTREPSAILNLFPLTSNIIKRLFSTTLKEFVFQHLGDSNLGVCTRYLHNYYFVCIKQIVAIEIPLCQYFYNLSPLYIE